MNAHESRYRVTALAPAMPLLLALLARPAAPALHVEVDHVRHAVVSFAATAHAFAFATSAGFEGDSALAISIGVASALGVAKELVDRAGGGSFDVLDLVWNGIGIAAAVVVVEAIR